MARPATAAANNGFVRLHIWHYLPARLITEGQKGDSGSKSRTSAWERF